MSNGRRAALGVVGALFLVAGIVPVAVSYQDHAVCGSLLGGLAQGLSSQTRAKCAEYAAAFYGGNAGIAVGAVLVIIAAVLRSESDASPYPPDWYKDPREPSIERW